MIRGDLDEPLLTFGYAELRQSMRRSKHWLRNTPISILSNVERNEIQWLRPSARPEAAPPHQY
jgi:hypothetical protein